MNERGGAASGIRRAEESQKGDYYLCARGLQAGGEGTDLLQGLSSIVG